MKKIVLILIFSFCFIVSIFSQYEDIPKNHIVIAINHNEMTDLNIVGALKQINNYLVTYHKIKNGDVLSMVRCSFDFKSRKLKVNTTKIYENIPVKNENEILNHIHIGHFIGNYKNIISVAKPFSLNALNTNSPVSNRFFLILITDNNYVGNNFYDEVENSSKSNITNIHELSNVCDNIQQNYFCQLIHKVETYSGLRVKAFIHYYEYIPIQQYFSIESVVDLPNTLTAIRKKDGYHICLEVKDLENQNFKPEKIKGILIQKHENSLIKIDSTSSYFSGSIAKLQIIVSSDKFDDSDTYTLLIKNWIQFKDGVLNSVVLHPNGAKLQGENGLNNRINVIFEKKARILWIIPLPDFMFKICFWTDNQNFAAASWSVLIFIILIIIAVIKINSFRIDNRPEVKHN